MKKNRLSFIKTELESLRKALTEHQLYSQLKTVNDLKIFMESHVFAVWDFMSLLKALQNKLTCTQVPWKPVADAKIARFVNEIVWGEESDVNEVGEPFSHFEMYLAAMSEVGASTQQIDAITSKNLNIDNIQSILANAELSNAQREFLQFTFEVIQTNEPHKIAAAFTFGREDLIPDMFLAILKDAEQTNNKSFPKFKYYLDRHIEIDGDEHGPLSLEMIATLCDNDDKKWLDVLETSVLALTFRIKLWDAIADEIALNRKNSILL
jgi:hypothetical protein